MAHSAGSEYAPSIGESAAISIATIEARALSMRRRLAEDAPPSLDVRLDRLSRLESTIRNNAELIASAVEQDFGCRGRLQSILSDVYEPLAAARAARAALRKTMLREKLRLPFPFNVSGRAWLEPQPAGLVGLITPASDPIRMPLLALIDALGAGNRIILKPSEKTPSCAHVLDRILAEAFDADEVSVVTGDAQVAIALAKMPIDHLFAAGSRPALVALARAAALNLTPTTLVPGSKAAALICPDYPVADAAQKTISAKLVGAGQSCEAPDLALVPADSMNDFIAAAQGFVAQHWPRLEGHPDYAAILTPTARRRLEGLLSDSIAKGARVVPLGPGTENFGPEQGKMRPVLLLDVSDDMDVLQEEILGPILPVLAYEELADAFGFIGDLADSDVGKAPLVSVFTHQATLRQAALENIRAGGFVFNDAGPGARPANMPLGSEGRASAGLMGGVQGIGAMTRLIPVFDRFRLGVLPRTRPPFTKQDEATIERLVRRGR